MFFTSSINPLAISDLRAEISELIGLPVMVKINSTWWVVELPGNKGFPLIIYAAMHPTLHISAIWLYSFDPNNTSGALYHLVATFSVNTAASDSDC